MIPADFDYVRADSVDDAIAKLADGGEDAKALAGGHSLLPLMKLRLAAPTLLVDVGRLTELRSIDSGNGSGGSVRIGALTTHAMLQSDSSLGLLAEAASFIADQQVRNRGTIGGSLAHGDPASDLPAVALAAEATIHAKGPDGERTIAAAELFEDYLTTSLGPQELITAIDFGEIGGFTHGYQKFTRRAEDWAMVGVCVLIKANDGSCEDVRIGLTNMGGTPLRASAAEEALRGQSLSAESVAEAAEQAAEGTSPPGDLNATPEYKSHLARVLTKRALSEAAGLL